jgi:hypothetical protein
MRLQFVVGLLACMVTWAQAADPSPDYFAYFPGSPFSLGHGFIQNNLNKQFVTQCVSATKADASPNTAGLMFSEVEVYLVKDYSSLLDKMGFDARVSAHSPTSGFDASYQEQRQRIEERNSLTAVVQIAGEYSAVVLENAKLLPNYSEMIDKGLVDEFVTECGARIVSKERRGVRLNAILSLSNVSSKSRQQIDASVGGTYGAASFTAEAKATFNKEFEEAKRDQRVSIKVKAIGGQGSDAFEQIISASIKDITSIDGIGEALAKYAKTLTKENAGVIGYFVADMPRLAVAVKDPWIQEKQVQLERLVSLYRMAKDKRDAVDAIVLKRDPRWVAYGQDGIASLQKQLSSAEALITQILRVHSSCKAAGEGSFTSACTLDNGVRSGVMMLQTVPLIGAPQVEYLLAVRTGPSADQTEMSDWKWADDRAVVRLLDHPPITSIELDYSNSPKAYRTGFFASVSKEVVDAKRAVLGVRVGSEYLEAVRAEFVADEGKFRSGYTEQPYVMRAFGVADLEDSALRGPVNGPGLSRGRRDRFFLMDLDNIVRPPEPPSACFGFLTNSIPECADYEKRYSGELDLALTLPDHVWPWVSFPAVVKGWISNGEARSGKGRLVLRAKDRFGGETVATLIRFEWEVDEALHLARVVYGFGDGTRREKWFIANLGEVSRDFPKLVRRFKWTGPRTEATDRSTFPAVQDKWNELVIKYCPSSATVIPKNAMQATRLTARVDTDRRTAAAVYVWPPADGLGIAFPYEIDVTLRMLVKTKEQRLGEPDFYASDKGC